MKFLSFQSFVFAIGLVSNLLVLVYIVTWGRFDKTYATDLRQIEFLDKRVVQVEDMVIKNERRTFETLSVLERKLKSSVKRFYPKTAAQNVSELVEQFGDKFFEQNVEQFANKIARKKIDQIDSHLADQNVDQFGDENIDQFVDDFNGSDVLEQERRRQKIIEVCRKYRKPSSKPIIAEQVFEAKEEIYSQTILPQSVLIDDVKTRSAYCYNFKAGASTWMRIFAQLYPDGGFWEDVKDSQQYYRVIYKMSAASVQRVREVFQSGDHFTFTVVRHPLDRILSAYRDRIMNGCTSQSKYNVPAVFVELRDSREQYYKTFLLYLTLLKVKVI